MYSRVKVKSSKSNKSNKSSNKQNNASPSAPSESSTSQRLKPTASKDDHLLPPASKEQDADLLPPASSNISIKVSFFKIFPFFRPDPKTADLFQSQIVIKDKKISKTKSKHHHSSKSKNASSKSKRHHVRAKDSSATLVKPSDIDSIQTLFKPAVIGTKIPALTKLIRLLVNQFDISALLDYSSDYRRHQHREEETHDHEHREVTDHEHVIENNFPNSLTRSVSQISNTEGGSADSAGEVSQTGTVNSYSDLDEHISAIARMITGPPNMVTEQNSVVLRPAVSAMADVQELADPQSERQTVITSNKLRQRRQEVSDPDQLSSEKQELLDSGHLSSKRQEVITSNKLRQRRHGILIPDFQSKFHSKMQEVSASEAAHSKRNDSSHSGKQQTSVKLHQSREEGTLSRLSLSQDISYSVISESQTKVSPLDKLRLGRMEILTSGVSISQSGKQQGKQDHMSTSDKLNSRKQNHMSTLDKLNSRKENQISTSDKPNSRQENQISSSDKLNSRKENQISSSDKLNSRKQDQLSASDQLRSRKQVPYYTDTMEYSYTYSEIEDVSEENDPEAEASEESDPEAEASEENDPEAEASEENDPEAEASVEETPKQLPRLEEYNSVRSQLVLDWESEEMSRAVRACCSEWHDAAGTDVRYSTMPQQGSDDRISVTSHPTNQKQQGPEIVLLNAYSEDEDDSDSYSEDDKINLNELAVKAYSEVLCYKPKQYEASRVSMELPRKKRRRRNSNKSVKKLASMVFSKVFKNKT